LETDNFGDLPCESQYFSNLIMEYNIKFSFITLEKTIFLLIMQDVLCLMFYISCKYDPYLCRNRNNFCSSTNSNSFFF